MPFDAHTHPSPQQVDCSLSGSHGASPCMGSPEMDQQVLDCAAAVADIARRASNQLPKVFIIPESDWVSTFPIRSERDRKKGSLEI